MCRVVHAMKMTGSTFICLDLLALGLQSRLVPFKYGQYSAVADLHTFQFTVAHPLRFSVSISRLAMDLNTETITSYYTLNPHRPTSCALLYAWFQFALFACFCCCYLCHCQCKFYHFWTVTVELETLSLTNHHYTSLYFTLLHSTLLIWNWLWSLLNLHSRGSDIDQQ
jgi:hypothetical protein